MDTISTGARVLHALIAGVWLGASLFFIALASRAAQLLGSRDLANALLSTALGWIDLYGIFAGPALLLTLFIGWGPLQVPLRLRALAAVVMTLATAASYQIVAPRLVYLREAMGRPIQDLDPSSAMVAAYDQQYLIASALMIVHTALAFLMIVSAVRSSRPARKFGIEL